MKNTIFPHILFAELILYITSTRVDLYSHQILLDSTATMYHRKFNNIVMDVNDTYTCRV